MTEFGDDIPLFPRNVFFFMSPFHIGESMDLARDFHLKCVDQFQGPMFMAYSFFGSLHPNEIEQKFCCYLNQNSSLRKLVWRFLFENYNILFGVLTCM